MHFSLAAAFLSEKQNEKYFYFVLLEAKKHFGAFQFAVFSNFSNSQLAARTNSLREKLKSFIVLAIFRKTKVFNGKFIIYASYILFFHMNNCSECKKRAEKASSIGISIQVLSENF